MLLIGVADGMSRIEGRILSGLGGHGFCLSWRFDIRGR